jgi:hypothetical protein
MVDLDSDEMDWPGHVHRFVITHEFPQEYMRDNNCFVSCNDCNHYLWDLDDFGDERGFLHCVRPYETKEWQVPCLRADLTVEDLLRRRLDLKMPWDDALVFSRARPEIECSFDLCWDCFFKTKCPNYIAPNCEI